MKNQAIKRGRFAAVLKGALAVLVIGAGGQMALGQNLLQNGDFSTGLSNWKTIGDVTAEFNHGVLKDTGTDPVLFQAVAVSGYAYELRFDIDLEDVSDRAGSGEFDSIRMVLYEGADAATLGPDTAAQTSALIEGNASGLTALVDKAQIAPNPVLGLGYASAVVEFISDYAAIAPGVILFNKNGMIDSTIRVTNVRLIAVDRGRLANISNRGAVGTDPDFMIPSFVLKGPDKKRFVIRGAGPWLAALGVQGTLDDPAFSLKTLSGLDISGNNDWGDNPNQTELIDAMTKVGAWGIPFADGSKDAALLQDEGGGLEANAYSIILEGRNLEPGDDPQVALAEVYDYDVFEDGATELVNISNRGRTSSGAGAQIPGFVISGDRGRIVLIRAVGPSLAQFVAGTLDDPILLLNQNVPGVGNQEVARNDDYHTAENADQVVATSQRIGAFALLPDEADSAILMALEPGVYTAAAQVKGDDESGVVLVEVYLVSDNTRPQAAPHVMFVGTQQSPPSELDMEQILNPLQDGEGDLLTVASFSQPQVGTVTEDDDGLLLFANDIGFVGQTYFNYTLTDGEYESAPGVIGLNVAPFGAKVWIGGSSSSFSDPDNWMDGQVPGDGADVWIVPVGEATVNIDEDVELKTLRVGGIGSEVDLTVPWNRVLATTGTMDVGHGSTLTLQGTVDTGDHLRVAGTLKWTGGTMAGDASTVIEPGGKAELSSGGRLELADDRDFLNRGKVLQSGNAYILSVRTSNSVITNAADADWDVASSGGRIAYSEADSSVLFTNAGDLYKSSATGQVIYGYSQGTSSFANQVGGRVIIEGGTLEFQGAGTGDHSGELMIADGAEALFTNGGHTFKSGSVISDTGTVTAGSGSTVSFAAAKTLESLRITNNGTVNHSGTLTVTNFSHEYGVLESDDNLVVTGELLWKGGTQDGSGGTLVEDGATAILTDTYLYLNGNRTLTNQGEVFQRSGCRVVATQSSQSVVTNAADGIWNLEMSNGQYMAYADTNSAIDIVNDGTLNKQDNQHTYYIGYSQGTNNFTNTGTINVPNGIIQFEGASNASQDGIIAISSGAEVILNRGAHTFGEDAEISDTGTLTIGAIAAVSMPNSLSLESLKIINSGTLTAEDDITVGTFTQSGGTFTSDSELLITDVLAVTAGVQSGSGETILGAEGEGTMSSSYWDFTGNHNFTNRGELELVGTHHGFRLTGNTQSTVTNAAGATLTSSLSNNYIICYASDAGSTANFVNNGTLVKPNVSTTNHMGYYSYTTNFTNGETGIVNVEGGTLNFQGVGTGTHEGTLTIAENATAYFAAGTHNFLTGATVGSSGTFHVNQAKVTVADALTIPVLTMDGSSGSLTAADALNVEELTQTYGTLSTDGDLTISDEFIWQRGDHAGSGRTVIGNEATATLSTTWLYLRGTRELVNNGSLTQLTSGGLRAHGTSQPTITNAAGATWTLNLGNNQNFVYCDNDSSVNFVNQGSLIKINTSDVIFGRNGGTQNFTNGSSGEIDVQTGGLFFDNLGTGTHQGDLKVASGATVRFRYGAHDFQAGATIDATASLQMAGGTLNFAEAATFDTLSITAGTLSNGANVTVDTLSQTGGTIDGSADLIVSDSGTVSGGLHKGAGTTVFDASSTLVHTGALYLQTGRAVDLRGTSNQTTSGQFYAQGGVAPSTVTQTGTLNLTASRLFNSDSTSTLHFVNNGTITKTSTNATTVGSGSVGSLSNNGTLEVQAGYLNLSSGLTLNLNAGGTARLTTSGQSSGKVIDGSGFINFGGTLELLLAVGYAPANNDTITFIDFGNGKGSGTFGTLTPPSGYASISQTLNAANLEITFTQ